MYDFEKALEKIQTLRETPTLGNYMPALRMLTTFLDQASIRNLREELARGLLHRGILHMHRHERASEDNETFLAQYFSDIQAGLQICRRHDLGAIEAQLERRMGDYYYEIGDDQEACVHYQMAIQLLPEKNRTGIRHTEYTAPLYRCEVLAAPNASLLKLLADDLRIASRKPKQMPQWQWLIIRAGVALKYAEAAHAVDSTSPLCGKLMQKAQADAERLDRMGYHQRLIQVRRLKRKLGFLDSF